MPQDPRSTSLESAGAKVSSEDPLKLIMFVWPSLLTLVSASLSLIRSQWYFAAIFCKASMVTPRKSQGWESWLHRMNGKLDTGFDELAMKKNDQEMNMSQKIWSAGMVTPQATRMWAYSSLTLEGMLSLSPLPTLHPQNYLGIIDICGFWKFFFFLTPCAPIKMFFGFGAMISLLSSPRTICWHFLIPKIGGCLTEKTS